MKYLITGGCGFLGSNIAFRLLSEGETVIVFDNLYRIGSSQNLTWLKSKGNIHFCHGDIRNRHELKNILQIFKPEVIYHLAGQVAMTTSIENPMLDFEVNAVGTFNLLDIVRQIAPHTIFIFPSTNKVYGDLEWVKYIETTFRYTTPDFPHGFPETMPLDFQSPYGCSKGCADQYVLDFSRRYGIRAVVFRHSSMFGERQFATFDQGWIGWFIQQALRQKSEPSSQPFTISGNGKQVRDILFIDDMVSLYQNIVKYIDDVNGNAFNIGGGIENSLSILELFNFLEQKFNLSLSFTSISPRACDQKSFVADISKIKKNVPWKPLIDKFQGIERMTQWLINNNDKLNTWNIKNSTSA